jgi:hypothetical protein
LIDQRAEALGFLERGKILALQVLDDADLERIVVAHQRRDGGEPGQLRGAVTPLTGHDHVAVARTLDDHRLQDAVLGDRGGELGERVRIEVLARLIRIRAHARERQRGEHGARLTMDGPGNQRAWDCAFSVPHRGR